MVTDGKPRHLASQQIQEFLDQELPPPEVAKVQEHLSACPRCQSEVDAWRVLYSELGSLPELVPGSGLSERVLAEIPARAPLGARLRGKIPWGATDARPGSHIPGDRLQDFAEGLLPARKAAGAEAHLAACEPCRHQFKGWERLFGTLAALGRFSPAPGFAERVLASVRVPSPLPAPWVQAGGRALAWTRGFLPQTRRGWAVAGGIASAPTISMGVLFYLVFSHPLLSFGSFTTYVSWKASAALLSLASALGSAAVDSVAVFRAYSFVGALARSPLLVGIGGLGFSLMSALALWVLYRNLMATPSVENRYARAQV